MTDLSEQDTNIYSNELIESDENDNSFFYRMLPGFKALNDLRNALLSLSEVDIEKYSNSSILAPSICELSTYTSKDEAKKTQLISSLLAKNIKFDKVTLANFPTYLHSQVYKSMLDNGLKPHILLHTAFNIKEDERRDEVIDLAFTYDIDYSSIAYLPRFISIDNLEKCLNYGLPLNLAVKLICSTEVYSTEARFQRVFLIDFLLNKKANINEILNYLYPEHLDKLIIEYITFRMEALLTRTPHPLTPDNLLRISLTKAIIKLESKIPFSQSQLIELALDKGADLNKVIDNANLDLKTLYAYKELFLAHNLSVSKLLVSILKAERDKDLAELQINLVKEAVGKGANISNKFIGRLAISLENLLSLKDILSANDVLLLAFNSINNSNKNPELYELIEFALKRGADINLEIQTTTGNKNLLSTSNDSKLISILKSHGAHCDINSKIAPLLLEHEGFYKYLFNSFKFSKIMNQNLAIEEGPINKIPYLVHHIWLTHPSSPREISINDILNTLNTKKKFEESSNKWNHIIWTNNKTLIPESIEQLEKEGITIRSIQYYKENIRLFESISDLINLKQWGMASDILRYSLVEYFGGVYADLNFELTRTVESEMHKYDFFAQSYTNNFFAAKAFHPIIISLVDMVERNLNSPPSYIAAIEDADIFTKTLYFSLFPFALSFFNSAHKDNNIDIIYLHHHIDNNKANRCDTIWKAHDYLTDFINICSDGKLLTIGSDGYKDSYITWMDDHRF